MSPDSYWLSGPSASQAASLAIAAPVGCTRITASSNEQKLRMPVWFRVTGTAVAKYIVAGGPPDPVDEKVYPLLFPPAKTLSIRHAAVETGTHGATPPIAASVGA